METTYYLFGQDAVNELNDSGITGLVKEIESNNITYSTFLFEEGVTKSVVLAEAFAGWDDYAIIPKEEFDLL